MQADSNTKMKIFQKQTDVKKKSTRDRIKAISNTVRDKDKCKHKYKANNTDKRQTN